jgi:protein-disulfide isomerase
LPIETRHSFAGTAAAAATCASKQGRFWEYHELLFSNSRTLDETRLFAFADQVGLAQRSFEACLHTRGPEKVQRDLEEARRLGLTGTPAFLLGRIQANRLVTVVSVISGSLPFREFQERIDDVLNPRVSSWWAVSGILAVGVFAGGLWRVRRSRFLNADSDKGS